MRKHKFGVWLLDMFHYNVPFADLIWRCGKISDGKVSAVFLLQEVKKEYYLNGRVPAARCNIENTTSGAALTKAGLEVSGYVLTGEVRINGQ